MSTFSEKLARARAAAPRTADIEIALDIEAVNQIGELEQEHRSIETRYEIQIRDLRTEIVEWEREDRLSDPRITEHHTKISELERQRDTELDEVNGRLDAAAEAANDSLVVIRVTRLPGQEWAELCALNPPRAGVTLDAQYGYDYQAVGAAAVRISGQVVDGDEVSDLEPGEWDELLQLASGHEFERICSTLFSLNEWGPEQAVRILGKASRDAASRKSTSPSTSASRRAASPGGNRSRRGKSSSTTDAPPA